MSNQAPLFRAQPIPYEDWLAEGERLFGPDRKLWRFVCPVCGHIQSAQDFQKAGADWIKTEGMIGFSCIGRITGAQSFKGQGQGPCNYAGGGLLRLNPTAIQLPGGQIAQFFDFDRSKKPNQEAR